ncbi:MAG TPA: squalene synthase HpnC [Dehalococcoidia bacterium]|nr:squalene synthase HpnC [Dehalococcoidia bacterium]
MLAEGLARSYTVEEAFAYCRQLAHGHRENFTVASFLLPADKRRYMYSVYAFCRGVDDLGDEAEGDRLALLDDWESELRSCYEGSPRHPAFVALRETISAFDIPPEPFLRLIEANRMDQRNSTYDTFSDIVYYCEHSANPVGHLVLYLFGYSDPERQALSDATCTALQLANFWQDVARDLEKGRCYIPLEDMQAFGYSLEALKGRVYNHSFRRLMAFEVQRARSLFADGLGLIGTVDRRLRVDLKLFSLGGLTVLSAIEAINYDVLHRRPSLSRLQKAGLFLRVLMPRQISANGGRP